MTNFLRELPAGEPQQWTGAWDPEGDFRPSPRSPALGALNSIGPSPRAAHLVSALCAAHLVSAPPAAPLAVAAGRWLAASSTLFPGPALLGRGSIPRPAGA